MKIINTKYNGNILYYKQAENDYNDIKSLSKHIEVAQNYINSSINQNNLEYIKYTYMNLHKNIIAYDYVETPGIILGYNLENLAVKRILPKSLSSFIDKCKFKDYKQNSYDKYDEIRNKFGSLTDKALQTIFSCFQLSIIKVRVIFLNFLQQQVYDSVHPAPPSSA